MLQYQAAAHQINAAVVSRPALQQVALRKADLRWQTALGRPASMPDEIDGEHGLADAGEKAVFLPVPQPVSSGGAWAQLAEHTRQHLCIEIAGRIAVVVVLRRPRVVAAAMAGGLAGGVVIRTG